MSSTYISLITYCMLHRIASYGWHYFIREQSGPLHSFTTFTALHRSPYRSLLLLLSRAGHTAERLSLTKDLSSKDKHVREQDVQR